MCEIVGDLFAVMESRFAASRVSSLVAGVRSVTISSRFDDF
jgi:hypothetical protein